MNEPVNDVELGILCVLDSHTYEFRVHEEVSKLCRIHWRRGWKLKEHVESLEKKQLVEKSDDSRFPGWRINDRGRQLWYGSRRFGQTPIFGVERFEITVLWIGTAVRWTCPRGSV